MTKFLDTNALLRPEVLNALKENNEKFYISSETLKEIENIKQSQNKSDEVKFQARCATRFLEENQELFRVIIVNKYHYDILDTHHLPYSADNLIIACLYGLEDDEIEFVSYDLLCRNIAKNIFNIKVCELHIEDKDEYRGFKEVILDDGGFADFYQNMNVNKFDCLINEYILIKNADGEVVDKYRWNGSEYVRLSNKPIKSQMFGDKIKAKDDYQSFVIDSIMNNTVTAITGRQGSGKSLLSLVCALNLIETKKYDSLVILFNPSKVKGVSDMGYYKGSHTDKAMQNSIGNTLISKFGDRYGIDLLVQQGKLKLISMADIRGMEIKDNEILYMTECQNTSIDIMKLCLGRVCEGAKVIIEGDYKSQVDSNEFTGSKNGLKRAIDVLKGNDLFGYIDLQNIWRSKIAKLVEEL